MRGIVGKIEKVKARKDSDVFEARRERRGRLPADLFAAAEM
jgi:hypothetical protein